MYSVYCHSCKKGPCRLFDVPINNDEFQAVVVNDPKLSITEIKLKGCPNVISIGLLDVTDGHIVDPHNSVLFEKPSKF